MNDATPQIVKVEPDISPDKGAIFFEDMWGLLPSLRWRNVGRLLVLGPITDPATAITTGDGKVYLSLPKELDGAHLLSVEAFCAVASSSGVPSFAVRNVTQGVDILTTNVTIDANETSSVTAATPAVILASHIFRAGDQITLDVDTAGTGCAGAGVILSLQ